MKNKRVVIWVDAEMHEDLKRRAAQTGARVGELVRRAIRLGQYADAQGARGTEKR